ncbi:MAG: HRDC domain-containing protein, partial [Spirochaetia bacterium]
LVKKLKNLRTEIARENNVPPYIVFSDKTLREMAAVKPESSEELLTVSGVGEKKLDAYGPRFLALIREHADG